MNTGNSFSSIILHPLGRADGRQAGQERAGGDADDGQVDAAGQHHQGLAGGEDRLYGLPGLLLGDRHQGHRIGRPAGLFGGSDDAGADIAPGGGWIEDGHWLKDGCDPWRGRRRR